MQGPTSSTDVPFVVDVLIAFALSLTVAYFLVVMECCRTNGALTRAELALMRSPPRTPSLHESKIRTR